MKAAAWLAEAAPVYAGGGAVYAGEEAYGVLLVLTMVTADVTVEVLFVAAGVVGAA